ncbi:MAG: hypothetical protein ING59_12585 [Burkholderiales bacterium]|nr:hypothetical protein [Burkholderiales bacterium]
MNAFTPEQVEQMRARLNELHAEFMAASRPDSWPRKLDEYHEAAEARAQKLHCTHLLRMMGELQRILDRVPMAGATTAGSDTSQHVAEARELGKAIRERLKGGLQ